MLIGLESKLGHSACGPLTVTSGVAEEALRGELREVWSNNVTRHLWTSKGQQWVSLGVEGWKVMDASNFPVTALAVPRSFLYFSILFVSEWKNAGAYERGRRT